MCPSDFCDASHQPHQLHAVWSAWYGVCSLARHDLWQRRAHKCTERTVQCTVMRGLRAYMHTERTPMYSPQHCTACTLLCASSSTQQSTVYSEASAHACRAFIQQWQSGCASRSLKRTYRLSIAFQAPILFGSSTEY